MTTRTNPHTGEIVALTPDAAEKYDAIERLTEVFWRYPPTTDRPFDRAVLMLWEKLKEDFCGRWPREYRMLID